LSQYTPFSIKIFVPDGDPDGLKVIERSNWNGRALSFPRSLLPEVKKRAEFSNTGVYMLLGPREDGEGQMLYIGEGDPVRPRLESHFAKKDFWTRAVFFVSSSAGALNKAHVQHLESRLVELAEAAKRMPLDNQQKPNLPTLNEADQADMEVFLSHILQIIPLLGIDAFEKPQLAAVNCKSIYTASTKGITATGYESSQGFVVQKGSQALGEVASSMKTYARGFYDLRQSLIDSGVLQMDGAHYLFTQDYSFNAPSAAAAVIMGRSANGRTEWKDAQGRTLKQNQEADVKVDQ